MQFLETCLPDVLVIQPEKLSDDRGFFARSWCSEEFRARGLVASFTQANISRNSNPGTLRGMHYQLEPHQEVKLVRCTRGAIYDVALDLRPDSPTFRRWTAAELTADNCCMLYVPAGCAHGYLTLTGDTEVFYLVSEAYVPASEAGVRYDDPAFDIVWPRPPLIISSKDQAWPLQSNLCHQTQRGVQP